jgi:hypothetical protein
MEGGVCGLRHAPADLPSGKDTVTVVEDFRWAAGSVWMGGENLATTGGSNPKLSRPQRFMPIRLS